MSEEIVFGQAMIHGHELEACVAKFPRIILDKALLPLIHYHDDHLYIDEDDGLCFINYLQMGTGNESWKSIFRYLNNHQKAIRRNIERSSKQPSICEKYEWLARYHDFFCRSNCQSTPELLISPKSTERFSDINWDRLQKLLR